MFGRATITLDIGPYSSLSCNLFVCNMICYLIHNYAHKFMDIVVVGHLKHDDNFVSLMYTSQICLSMKFLPCDTILVLCCGPVSIIHSSDCHKLEFCQIS